MINCKLDLNFLVIQLPIQVYSYIQQIDTSDTFNNMHELNSYSTYVAHSLKDSFITDNINKANTVVCTKQFILFGSCKLQLYMHKNKMVMADSH